MSSAAFRHLKMTMQSLATIIFNASQNNMDYNSKDAILNSLIMMIEDYNNEVDEQNKIKIEDFRKRK